MTRSTAERADLAAALREWARTEAGEPVSDEELFGYLAGTLTPDVEAEVRRYLVASPEGRARLTEIEPFARPAPPGGPAAIETFVAWRDLRSRLAVPVWRRRYVHSGVAAALLVTCLGLTLWVWQLQSHSPRPVVVLQSLELVAATRGQGAPERLVTTAGEPFQLLLYLPELPADCTQLAVDVLTPAGRSRDLGQLPVASERLSLLFYDAAPGRYQVDLRGCGISPQSFVFEVALPP